MPNYTKGKIYIPDVSGNIEITVHSTPQVVPIVNLAETYGMTYGYRISSSTGANSSQSGYAVVGADNTNGHIIPYEVGDVFRIKGAIWPTAQDTKIGICPYTTSSGGHPQTAFAALYIGGENRFFSFSYDSTNDIATITVTQRVVAGGQNHDYIRFSLHCTTPIGLIITKNQVIS